MIGQSVQLRQYDYETMRLKKKQKYYRIRWLEADIKINNIQMLKYAAMMRLK